MKRKGMIWLLALCLILQLGAAVYASEPTDPIQDANPAADFTGPSTEPPTVPPTEPPTVPPTAPAKSGFVTVDTESVFDGMDRSYGNGYAPRLENGEAVIVVPLIPHGELREVRASLDLGDHTAPFVMGAYEKTFQRAPVQTESEEAERILVDFRVPLSDSRQNGVYPVLVKLTDPEGSAEDMEIRLYVTVGDVEVPEPTQPPRYYPEVPTAEPVVYISESRLEPETVSAGEDFTLTLTLRNSIKTKDVKNLLVTVDPGSLSMTLREKSNVLPVETIKRGEETQLVLHFRAEPDIEEGKHSLNFSFRYDSSRSLGLSSQGSVLVNVRQPVELTYDGAVLPPKIFQGDSAGLALTLMNTGKSPIRNVRVELEAEGLTLGGSIFVGEIPAGESKPGRGTVRPGEDFLGETAGVIRIRYEDVFGQEYVETQEIHTWVEPKPEPAEEPEEKTKGPGWWLYLVLGLAAGGAAGFGIPKLLREIKQRKEDDLRL